MESGILTRYSASAGSGKTYKLTGIYLSRLFSSGNAYKRMLAVTFTNKAAADMKRKILSQLFSISEGEKNKIADDLAEKYGYTPEELAGKAQTILGTILHDYSGFNVGTIDSFFQKILRAFTREIGMQYGFVIEIDHSRILSDAVERTLSDTAKDEGLKRWIIQYSLNRLEEGRGWNLKEDILKLSGEIFNERFRMIDKTQSSRLSDREFLTGYAASLKSARKEFEDKLRDYSGTCNAILAKHNADGSMFYRGNNGGVGTFLKTMTEGQEGIFKPLNTVVSKVLESPPVWASKSGPPPELRFALDDNFAALFTEALGYYQANFRRINTAILIAENIYILGILSDILKNVHEITSAGNRFLLSDAGELLWLLVKDDQTPFIYEKAGNVYENFMIDEFQDTSRIQWNNFRPLIENSLAEGHDNLVVGDVKQAIYRWRNSDWRIMEGVHNELIGTSGLKTELLGKNWRSRKNIISFNNTIFSILPAQIDASEQNPDGSMLLSELYRDAVQDNSGQKEGGLVRIELLDNEEEKFEELSLLKLPGIIEELQDNGYKASDIGILVRTNSEGAAVLNSILGYREKAGEEKTNRYNYNVVSAESLLLSKSPAIEFIISVIRQTIDPSDQISASSMLRSWLIASGRNPLDADLSDLPAQAENLFPEGYGNFVSGLKELPLFEAVERGIEFFGIGTNPGNTPYLNAFQDYLLEFSGTDSADTSKFLEWWDTTGNMKSIILSDSQDSVRVMTIHKSKGLEFKAVILPFASWSLGHGNKSPVMWIDTQNTSFPQLRTVPVKYKTAMQFSDFSEDYRMETYFAFVDNLNLLYVAFTRAIDVLIVHCPSKSKQGSVAGQICEALTKRVTDREGKLMIDLYDHFDKEDKVFSYGNFPGEKTDKRAGNVIQYDHHEYYVNHGLERLRLKLNGENLLSALDGEISKKLNYGRLMHEVFESVMTPDDIIPSIDKMVIGGRIPANEKYEILRRIFKALEKDKVKEWFRPGLRIMNEAEILTTEGSIRRPDRIIIDGDKLVIVDFKFGAEKKKYLAQVNDYRKLLYAMGYPDIEAWLWYVDNDLVIKV